MSFLIFVLSLCLRFRLNEDNFYIVRGFYSFCLILFYFKLFKLSYGIAEFGLIFITIQEMIKDIINLIFIIAVFLMTYGIITHSLINQNTRINWKFLEDILFYPYIHIFGELSLERVEIREDVECNRTVGSMEECQRFSWLAFIYFIIYMIMVNVLLVNLLIATITNTYLNIRKNSENWYCFQKVLIITDFCAKPIFPPPFNILLLLPRFIYSIFYKKNEIVYGDFINNMSFNRIDWIRIAERTFEGDNQ